MNGNGIKLSEKVDAAFRVAAQDTSHQARQTISSLNTGSVYFDDCSYFEFRLNPRKSPIVVAETSKMELVFTAV